MRLYFIVLFGILAAATIGAGTNVRGKPMKTDNEKHLKQAADLIKAFNTEREPERLREATLELDEVDLRRVSDKKLRHKQRAQCLELWLTVINTVDKNLDANFDPDFSPPLKVSPPPLKDGTVLMPGADPKLIDDPKAREEYEKAIKENRAKQEASLIQTQLRELNERLPSKFDSYVQRVFTRSDEDKAEIRAAIDRIIENETRRVSLYRTIEEPSE
jgi:hypothetical protein